ncbi:MAG: hypothetical protein LZF86_40090 [Nitrospira sp.]|nr:MAG: hypothetical protein LZF86_40090 [Nitrospira sp.]
MTGLPLDTATNTGLLIGIDWPADLVDLNNLLARWRKTALLFTSSIGNDSFKHTPSARILPLTTDEAIHVIRHSPLHAKAVSFTFKSNPPCGILPPCRSTFLSRI